MSHTQARCGDCGTLWSKTCRDCGYSLMPEQNICPECGVDWAENSAKVRRFTSSHIGSWALLFYGGTVVFLGIACSRMLVGGPLATMWLVSFFVAFTLSGVPITTAFIAFVWHEPRRWTLVLASLLIFVGSYPFTFAFTIIVALTLT